MGATRQRGAAVRNAPRDGSDAQAGDASGRSTDAMDVMEVAMTDPMRLIVTNQVHIPTCKCTCWHIAVPLIVDLQIDRTINK